MAQSNRKSAVNLLKPPVTIKLTHYQRLAQDCDNASADLGCENGHRSTKAVEVEKGPEEKPRRQAARRLWVQKAARGSEARHTRMRRKR